MADLAISTQYLTYKYRLLPTRGQHRRLQAALDHTRDLYNAALQERIDAYQRLGLCVSNFDQNRSLVELRSDPEWAVYASTMQRWPLKQLDLAFQAFFRRVKAGETPGFPRFRGRQRFKTFGFSDVSGWAIEDGRIRIKGVGAIRYRAHRKLPAKPVSLKIRRQGRQWVALVIVKVAVENHPRKSFVGLDLGVAHLATLSTGEQIPNSKSAEKLCKAVRRAQRALSRCRRGSNRRLKVRRRLARLKSREANARCTYLHQVSSNLIQRFRTIVVEELMLHSMVRSAKGSSETPGTNVKQKSGTNRSLHDVALAKLVQMLDYKAAKAGGQVIRVDPRHTSQTCSRCGLVDAKSRRSQSEFVCTGCGHSENADVNAAKNIARRAGVVVRGEHNVAAYSERAHGNIGQSV